MVPALGMEVKKPASANGGADLKRTTRPRPKAGERPELIEGNIISIAINQHGGCIIATT